VRNFTNFLSFFSIFCHLTLFFVIEKEKQQKRKLEKEDARSKAASSKRQKTTPESKKPTEPAQQDPAGLKPAAVVPKPAAGVPKTILVDNKQADDMSAVDQLTVYKKQVEDQMAEIALLKRNTSSARSVASSRRGHVNVENHLKELIRTTLKVVVWRHTKFVYSSDQIHDTAKKVLFFSGQAGYFKNNDFKQPTTAAVEWCNEYQEFCLRALNEHRQACCAAIQKEVFNYFRLKKEAKIPDEEQFLKILRRDPDVDQDLFAWYWVSLLPKAAGSASIWNDQVKYFGCISRHAPPKKPKEVYITPATEAFCVLVLENYRDRWPKLYEAKSKTEGKVSYVKKDPLKPKPGYTYINLDKDPLFKGKWTKTDSGQEKFGGWAPEGLLKFTEYRNINKEVRRKPATLELEAAILEKIKKENGIEGSTWEEHRTALKGMASIRPKMVQIDDLIDDNESVETVGV